ncbi:unnamed protein product [Rhizoctonia solani]|uniref:Nephrocystin 3-like N-terminal domain-containing protein n=1 Tax=Rhizoctonia solani TaxID=456999 RepID=A0A8H2Y2I5_9AGAM|nr:unnamed protein product [Rhizoctonia solani]
MASPTPTPKRKRSILPTGISDALLHASWRSKRARSGSRSGSPTDSRASTPEHDSSPNISQSSTRPHSPSPEGSGESQPAHPLGHLVPANQASAPQILLSNLPTIVVGSASARETGASSWNGLEQALRALHITTKGCSPLHSAVDDLISCLQFFKEAAKPRKDYDELATGLTAMIQLLVKHLPTAAPREITEAISGISEKIVKEVESINKRQSRGATLRMLGPSSDDEDLIRRYRRIEQLFRQLQAEASMSTWNDTKRHLVNTQLENLGPVKRATYNSDISIDIGRRSCTENTRTQILSDSMAWADDPTGAKIYWMNGMAGTGKTTIAYSLCERLEAAGQLASSYFCTRTSRECSEAKQIVPTIAYQLARRSAPFRDALCGVLDRAPDIGTLETSSQFHSLLVKPLVDSQELIPRNLVIVIDALDECSDPHAVKAILDILFRYAADLPVKFFVTSRPEPTIRSRMMLGIAKCDRQHSILYLHEIEKSLVQADIELYLKDELKHMLPAHCDEIEELAEQAGNLFIYAATAVRYINPGVEAVDSRQRLKTILEVEKRSKKSTSDIDTLYTAILSAAIDDKRLELEEQERIRAVLWTLICAREPILVSALAVFSGLDEAHLAVSALEPLRSVLHVSEHNSLVTTLHASFPDFIFSQERSQEYFCNRTTHDQFLAIRCLEIMRIQLRFNICGLESSFALDDEIPDLNNRVKAHISPELCYVSRFWADHLTQGAATEQVLDMIQNFLKHRLLFWMEVMNLTKCMVAGSVASTKVHAWLRSLNAPSNLVALARDAQMFVGKYVSQLVSASTPHIYISALPLTSATNSIRSVYMPRFTGLVKATGTYMERTEEASLETWQIFSRIHSVSFSTDRNLIVIGDHNGRIYVKDSQGNTLTEFKAHRKAISSVAFSNNGSLIASSSHDHTICVWRVSDGSRVSVPFKGHSNRVNSVAFSPDSMRLASGSEDTTIRIWVTNKPSSSKLMAGHAGTVRSVVFSPDGLLVASGSSDKSVQIWDALDGVLLRNLRGHTQSVACVRFSPCGKYIFSGSNDRTIRSWSTHDGTPIGKPLEGHTDRITSIAVSPEGERIVSGSLDRTVRVWDKASGKLMAGPFEGHAGPVRSVGLSADGARIISASDDGTVRVWNAQGRTKNKSTRSPLKNTSDIRLTVVSSTREYLASRHSDESIRMWKLQNDSIEIAWTLLNLVESAALRLVFSSDCAHIFVAYSNGVMRVASVQTGDFVGDPRRYSPHEKIDSRIIELSSDGRSVISGSGFSLAGSLYRLDLWDIQRNCLIHTIKPRKKFHFERAEFNSSSAWFATGSSDQTADLWDRFTGVHLYSFGTKSPRDIFIAPNGTRLFYQSLDNRVCVYDTVNEPHTMLTNHLTFESGPIVISRSEAYLAHANENSSTIGLYEVARENMTGRIGFPKSFSGVERNLVFVTDEICLVWASESDRVLVITHQVGRFSVIITSDGWALDENSNKMIWVPREIRDGFLPTNGFMITREDSIAIRYENMLVGERWMECYIGDGF